MDMDSTMKETHAESKFSELPVIKVLKTELKQLFQNVICNVIQFRRLKEIHVVEITAEMQDSMWVFAIEDKALVLKKNISKKYSDFSVAAFGIRICRNAHWLSHLQKSSKFECSRSLITGSTFFKKAKNKETGILIRKPPQ